MLRGNHETREMTTFYNFRDQCIKQYDAEVYECFSDAFEALPVAAIVNSNILSLHGGISPQLEDVDMIQDIERMKEPGHSEMLMDLLWADPLKQRLANTRSFETNNDRGVSVKFGYEPLKKLLTKSKLKSLVRAHELQKRGFKFHNWGEKQEPICISIFSAPNYCQSLNEAAIMSMTEDNHLDVLTFEETAHKPYSLPSGALAFETFQPHLDALILDAIYHILRQKDKPMLREESHDSAYVAKVVAACRRYNHSTTRSSQDSGAEQCGI
mmetsp:Transcript_41238/g.54186  ORF Transcript_41238/g.54186 Transcript_41238/m.54186 type:complete len:269 (+) Transcript_41238:515-1321(+)